MSTYELFQFIRNYNLSEESIEELCRAHDRSRGDEGHAFDTMPCPSPWFFTTPLETAGCQSDQLSCDESWGHLWFEDETWWM